MPSTRWRGSLALNDTIELPISFTINPESIAIENGGETFVLNDIIHKDDSIIFRMPVFDSEFRCRFIGGKMQGFVFNYARKTNNIIPFHAVQLTEAEELAINKK